MAKEEAKEKIKQLYSHIQSKVDKQQYDPSQLSEFFEDWGQFL
eukprot:CAMPEP_0201285902 /NCGR_PEP_ID=MMETSP1317-20130820/113974_1 /ASSEMBLY_ACC=CAM_ASM_000770 /TAXON_ID=187299 /ORGANISM="Undescribed Undescribed, Strain Undescribed" /LENGTH=42 /DNA_ID= /DNA_START= /DNA_END= /DNA_ORIENTATION=